MLIFGIFIGNKIINKNRKPRANELQDNFEYKSQNDDINIDINNISNKYKNDKNETKIEMILKNELFK